MFPELRESEDERIRKAIVTTIKQCPDDFLNPKNRDRMLEWLEKQKEPKHAPDDLQKSFEAGQTSIVDYPEQYGLCKKAEWSEEDEKMRYFVTEAVQSRYSDRELAKYLDPKIINEKKQLKQKLFDWLRCIHHSWEPSKQQMEALHEAVIRSCSHHYGVELSNLEIDLLNLK